MDITFDAAKSASNMEKHGVGLDQARQFEWSDVMFYVDTRRDYKE